MSQTPMPGPAGFSKLSKSEQVRYLLALWDQIADAPGEMPVPESHLELAEARLQDYRKDPSSAHSALKPWIGWLKSPSEFVPIN